MADGVVHKVAAVLRWLADAGEAGTRLKDLSEATGLARPTAHRLLRDLEAEGLVTQTAGRRYALGRGMFEIALSAPAPLGRLERFQPLLRHLAHTIGDVVYLSMRRGATMHYLVRDAGPYPIRTYTVDVGEQRSITSSYAGLVMLAAMAPEASTRFIRAGAENPASAVRTLQLVARLQTMLAGAGYIAGEDLVLDGVAGIAGVAVPVPNQGRQPFLVVSASAVADRLPPQRYADVAASLIETAAAVAELLDDDEA